MPGLRRVFGAGMAASTSVPDGAAAAKLLCACRAAGVPFAAAGWANDIPEIEGYMRRNCDYYFKTVAAFGNFLEQQ